MLIESEESGMLTPTESIDGAAPGTPDETSGFPQIKASTAVAAVAGLAADVDGKEEKKRYPPFF